MRTSDSQKLASLAQDLTKGYPRSPRDLLAGYIGRRREVDRDVTTNTCGLNLVKEHLLSCGRAGQVGWRSKEMGRLCLLTLGAICPWLASLGDAQMVEQLQIGGRKIVVHFDSAPSDSLRKLFLQRIALSAKAVSIYYQQYPVAKVDIRVGFHDGRGVNSGRAFGSSTPHISISVGRASTDVDFAEDWVSTHEMVHLAFPSVAEEHHWIEEGLATYVEPIARARIGELSAKKVWGDMVDGMPKGLPEPGDRGLDFTHTWGRTYWGGALFCLLADVEFRKRTGNQKGLEDAVRGILKAGGSIESEWTLARALEIADRAAGVSVLEELYEKMKAAPFAPDLGNLWQQLGVERRGADTVFNDFAPLAAIRKAITEPVDHPN